MVLERTSVCNYTHALSAHWYLIILVKYGPGCVQLIQLKPSRVERSGIIVLFILTGAFFHSVLLFSGRMIDVRMSGLWLHHSILSSVEKFQNFCFTTSYKMGQWSKKTITLFSVYHESGFDKLQKSRFGEGRRCFPLTYVCRSNKWEQRHWQMYRKCMARSSRFYTYKYKQLLQSAIRKS